MGIVECFGLGAYAATHDKMQLDPRYNYWLLK